MELKFDLGVNPIVCAHVFLQLNPPGVAHRQPTDVFGDTAAAPPTLIAIWVSSPVHTLSAFGGSHPHGCQIGTSGCVHVAAASPQT